jgi:hypothetical protein
MCAFASLMDTNSVTFRHSSRGRPLNDSHKPLSVGSPGYMKCNLNEAPSMAFIDLRDAEPESVRKYKPEVRAIVIDRAGHTTSNAPSLAKWPQPQRVMTR